MTVQIFVYKFLFTIVLFGKRKKTTHETFHILKMKTHFEKELHFENESSFRNLLQMLAEATLVYFQTLLIQLAQLLYSAAGVNLTYEIVTLVICSMRKRKSVIFQTMWNVKLIPQD